MRALIAHCEQPSQFVSVQAYLPYNTPDSHSTGSPCLSRILGEMKKGDGRNQW